jgi:hypothetical protein
VQPFSTPFLLKTMECDSTMSATSRLPDADNQLSAGEAHCERRDKVLP